MNKSPFSVTARATFRYAFNPERIDKLFEDHSQRGYTKELLFSTTVDLMALVVSNQAVNVKAAFLKLHDRIPVQPTNIYEKLKHIETRPGPFPKSGANQGRLAYSIETAMNPK